VDGTSSNIHRMAVWLWHVTSSSQRRRGPRKGKETKMRFLHACWEPAFLHGQVLEATLELQLSFSHLKEAD